ncbi:MAG: CRISPR-associated CARF protein Csa3 [Methanobacterium sp.]
MTHTLISTIYSIEPVMFCITHFSPKKIVLLVDVDPDKVQSEAIRMLSETVGKVLDIELKQTSVYDLLQIAEDTVDVIWAEHEKKNRITVNVSGGRKPQALGALFGCYARPDLIEKIVYVTEEEKTIIELPILNFGISKTKRRILEELDQGRIPLEANMEFNLDMKDEINELRMETPVPKGEISVRNLSEKIEISRGMAYNHIRELRQMGLIDRDKLEITTAGKLAII